MTNIAKNDPKKTEHASERHEIAQDMLAIRNLKSFSQEKKNELIEELLDKKAITQTPGEKDCPYPQHTRYLKLRKKLTPDQQQEMKQNIRISDDGKIEIIKMGKKFSILTAEHNGDDILQGGLKKDRYDKTGIAGVTYLTSKAAERICTEQNKQLLNDMAQVKEFIGYFPGESEKEKIFNFVNLFGLKKAGYRSSERRSEYGLPSDWNFLGLLGFVGMSKGRVEGLADGFLCEVMWNDRESLNAHAHAEDDGYMYITAGTGYSAPHNLRPYVVCEDC